MKDLVRSELQRIHKTDRARTSGQFKNAKSGKEVTVYLEGQPRVYQDLAALVDFKIDGVKIVKTNENKSAAMPDVSMIDLKINIFGPYEDSVYAAFPVLVKNIRRGNTVLKYKENGQINYTFGRKGLEKFFDLRYEHISHEQRYDDDILNDETHMHKNSILAGALKAILDGHQVEILKTLKANGENVQVSWN